jgi:hypothetical protein
MSSPALARNNQRPDPNVRDPSLNRTLKPRPQSSLPVRAKHVVRTTDAGGQTKFVWADVGTAKREFMEIAFQQRRQQIVGDCRQLKSDVDSYNEKFEDLSPPFCPRLSPKLRPHSLGGLVVWRRQPEVFSWAV